MNSSSIEKDFKERFGTPAVVVHAPGRINIIGEHTDYNNGFVLPAAVDKKITFALSKNKLNGTVRVYAQNLDEYITFQLQAAAPSTKGWLKYIMAITDSLLENDQGFDCVFGGDLPIGSGMSSSSAVTCGLTVALSRLFDLDFPTLSLIKKVQEAEALYTGVRGGIMDQFSIMKGKKDQVIKLDCQSLDYQYFPLALGDYTLLLCNTGVQHELASSEYNTRRAECEKGVAILQQKGAAINSLREVTLPMINQYRDVLDETIFNRCYFVVKENNRVLEACKALQNGDLKTLGVLMDASHFGLQQEYQVSCTELDFLVDQTRDLPAVLGARMMGGGFGGCTINLVQKDQVDEVVAHLAANYLEQFNRTLETYDVHIGDGLLV